MAGILDFLATALPRSIFANMKNYAALQRGMTDAQEGIFGAPKAGEAGQVQVTPQVGTLPGEQGPVMGARNRGIREPMYAANQNTLRPGLLDAVPQQQRPFIEGLAKAMGPDVAAKAAYESNVTKPMSAYEQSQPDKPIPVADGTSLVDPKTHQPVFTNQRKQARPATSDELSQYNLPPGTPAQVDANGVLWPINQPGAGGGVPSGYERDPTTSQLRPITGGPADPKVVANLEGVRQNAQLQSSGLREGGTWQLNDGRIIGARFNPKNGNYEFATDDTGKNWSPVPSSARPITPGAGGPLTQAQYDKLEQEYTQDNIGLQRLERYFTTLGGTEQGIQRIAVNLSAQMKTLFGGGKLTPAEFAQQSAKQQLQTLLGGMRLEVLGPGVLTETDAQRIIQSLGGNVDSWQNPEIVAQAISQAYEFKRSVAQLKRDQLLRSSPVYSTSPAAVSGPVKLTSQPPTTAAATAPSGPPPPPAPLKSMANDLDYSPSLKQYRNRKTGIIYDTTGQVVK